MKTGLMVRISIVLLAALFPPVFRAVAQAKPEAIESRSKQVEGTNLHYLTAGHPPALLPPPRYTHTSRMRLPLIPKLAQKFTVIAPDLPGIGDSEIPKDGLDM